MAVEGEKVEGQEEEKSVIELILDDETQAEVRKAVLEANTGKAEHELADEFEAAQKAKLESLQEENKAIIAKTTELAKDPANADKTEDELVALAITSLAESSKGEDEGASEGGLGSDFFGKGSKVETEAIAADGKVIPLAELPEEVKTKIARVEKLEEDVVYKAFVKAKEENADIDFVELIIKSGLTRNPSTVTPVELKLYELKEMQKEDSNITNEEIEDAIEAFKEKGYLAQREETKSLREALITEYNKSKQLLATKINQDVNASKETLTKTIGEAETALKTEYLGQKFFGITLTEKHTTKVLDSIRANGLPKGVKNVQEAIEAQLLTDSKYDILNAAYEAGKRDANKKNAIKQGKPMSGLKARPSGTRGQSVSREASLKEAQKLANMQ